MWRVDLGLWYPRLYLLISDDEHACIVRVFIFYQGVLTLVWVLFILCDIG